MNTTSVAFVNSRITLTNTCYRRFGATSWHRMSDCKKQIISIGSQPWLRLRPKTVHIQDTYLAQRRLSSTPSLSYLLAILTTPISRSLLPHPLPSHAHPVPVTTGLSIHDTYILCLTSAQAQLCFLWVMDAHMDEHAASNKHRKLSCFQ